MQEKLDVYGHLKKLETILKEDLVNNKENIVKEIESNKRQGGEVEGIFTKRVLSRIMQNAFQNNVVIEGMDSKGKTKFKQFFFGAKGAPDFIIENPRVVGEVKYGELNLDLLGKAIGKTILYIANSKKQSQKFEYGCIVFFDTSSKFNETVEEGEFIKYLWENVNVFLIII